MQAILQNLDTSKFYRAFGVWLDDPRQAYVFPSESIAIAFAEEHRFQNVLVVSVSDSRRPRKTVPIPTTFSGPLPPQA